MKLPKPLIANTPRPTPQGEGEKNPTGHVPQDMDAKPRRKKRGEKTPETKHELEEK